MVMKKFLKTVLIFANLIICFSLFSKEKDFINITIESAPKKSIAKIPVFIGILDHENQELNNMIPIIKENLEKSGQLKLEIKKSVPPTNKQDIQNLSQKGLFVVYIDTFKNNTGIKWLLYDPTQPRKKIAGKKISKQNLSIKKIADLISDQIWEALMGTTGAFASKICYVKRVWYNKNHFINKLCTCDFDGTNEKVLLTSTRILAAPHWGADKNNPFIVFSEFTNSNVRLMSIDLLGNKSPIIDLDGTSVGVSFNAKTNEVLYCRSGNIWKYHHDAHKKRGIHSLLIREGYVSVSPNLLSNGHVIYCSRAKIKEYDPKVQEKLILVEDGYNVSPSFNEFSNQIVYAKRVKGLMQIFIYNKKTKKEKQMTFDVGDKLEPAWAPGGDWIIFCVEKGKQSRMKIVNTKTKKSFELFKKAPKNINYYYPAFSFAEILK